MRGIFKGILFKFLCVHVCVTFPVIGLSQSTQLDSLEQILNTTVHDTVRFQVHEELFDLYIEKDLDKSLELAHTLREEAEKLPSQDYLGKAYIALGTVSRKQNISMDTVLGYYEKALGYFEASQNEKYKGTVLNNLGGVYQRYGFYPKALTHFQGALEISERMKDTLSMIRCIANLGNVHLSREDFNKAEESTLRALSLAQKVNHSLYVAMISNNLGNVYFNQQVYDTALVYYGEALKLKRELGSELSLIITLANIGGVHVEQKRHNQARPYLAEAYGLASTLNYPYGQGLSLRYMANSAFLQGNYDEAIQLSKRGVNILGQKTAIQYSRDFQNLLFESYEQLDKPDSALFHLKSFLVLNDSLFQLDKEKQLQQLELSYQVREKELENKVLLAEKTLIQRKLNTRTYLTLGLVLILLLGSGWAITVYRNSQVKKQINTMLEAQVASRTQDLQLANKELERAHYELQTFNFITSHDLKEPINNMESYVNLIHQRLPKEVQSEMQRYFEIIQQNNGRLNTLIDDIAKYSYLSGEDFGKVEKVDLQTLVWGIERELTPFVKSRKGQVLVEKLPQILSNAALLTIALKNLIENGIKFNRSAKPTVEVHYQATPSHHQIMISDNGIGIDSKYHGQIFDMFKRLHSPHEFQGSGNGLAIVKLVIEKLGGTLEVDSQEGEGSRFIIRLPRHSPEQNGSL